MRSSRETVEALIREWFGKKSADWIASEAGVTTQVVRNIASEMGVSLATTKWAEERRAYYCRPPKGEGESFAADLRLIQETFNLRSVSAALCEAVTRLAKMVRDGTLDA